MKATFRISLGLLCILTLNAQVLFAQPVNDDCATATVVAAIPFTDAVNTRLANAGASDPVLSCADGGGGKTVWYRFTPASDVFVTVNTRGSLPEDYDTALALFLGACDSLVELACNDDITLGENRQSEIFFQAVAGQSYIIHVAEWNGGGPQGGVPTGGNLVFNIEETTPPPLFAGPASGSITGGVSVNPNDFPSLSMVEKAARPQKAIPLRDVAPRKMIKQPLIPPTGPVGSNFVDDRAATKPRVETEAPIVTSNFQGVPDRGAFIPPDPIMAAGPEELIGCVNSEFGIFDKDGTLVKLIDAAAWYDNVLSGASPCDPQIVFDPHSNRWVMIWIECGSELPSLFLSVSNTDDPMGTWCNWRIPGDVNGSEFTGFADDYPKLGIDDEAIYVGSNMFSSFSFEYVRLRIIPKAQLLGNDCGPITWTDFWDLRNPTQVGDGIFTLVPAVTFGTPGVEYFVDVDRLQEPGTFMNVWSLSDPLSASPSLSAVAVPVTAFLSPTDADQLGGGIPRIDVGGRRVRNVVYQNGSLWTAHSVGNAEGEFARARYVRIDVATATAVEDVAFGEDDSWYYYPAVHPDGNDNLVMAFTRSGTTEYPSACYTGRLNSEPPGLQPSAILKAGEENYVKTLGGGRNRWGDYMGIARDPADPNSVWMFVEYAAQSVGPLEEDNRWGTWFGRATYTPLPGAQIAVQPTSFNFGKVEVGNVSKPVKITIINQGDTDLNVSGISDPGADFSLSNLPNLPILLGTFASVEFEVAFAPQESGQVSATIDITSDDADDPVVQVNLSGEGFTIAPAEFGITYASTGRAASPQGGLIVIDPATGVGTLVGVTGVSEGVSGLAVNSKGEIYGTQRITGDLYRIDATTGEAHFAASTGLRFLDGMAFDLNDVLYGISADSAFFGLHIIDPASGAHSLVGPVNDNYTGLAFDPTTGTLWASTGGFSPNVPDAIVTIDPATAEATFVGTTGLRGATPGIDVDNSGNLYGVKGGGQGPENNFIAIDKATGAGTVIGPIGFTAVSGLASRPGIPEGSHISVVPAAIRFGRMLVGTTSPARRITLRSIGTDTLIINSITDPGAPFPVSDLPTLPLILSPGEAVTFQVVFAPVTAGDFAATISIGSNDGDDPERVISLSGSAKNPAPAGTALFAVDANTSTILRLDPVLCTVLDSIPTPEPSFFGGPGMAYDGASLFFVTEFGSGEISEIDPLTGQVRNTIPVPQCGTVGALAHSGSSLFAACSFENRIFELDPTTGDVLNSFAPQVFVLGNLTFGGSRGTLFAATSGGTISELNATTGADLNSFPVPDGFLQGLAYSDHLGALFASMSNGKIYILNPDNGSAIDSCASPGFVAALAADEYVLQIGAHLSLSPPQVNFGRLLIGNTSRPRLLNLRSVGTDTVTVTSIVPPGAPFELSNLPSLPVAIAPLGRVELEVSFSPFSAGPVEAVVAITSNDADEPTQTATLRGEGVTPPPPGTLFGSTGQTRNLITIDPATGDGELVGTIDGVGSVTEIEFRNDGTLFGTTGGGTSNLITIDLVDGTPAVVSQHDLGALNGLEFDAAGRLYGAHIPFPGSPSEMVIVDTETAELTFIGSTGFLNIGGLAFGPDSTLYGVTSGFFEGGALITIDRSTGAGTLVGNTGFSDVASLEFGPDGVLYGGLGGQDPRAGSLITIDPETGASQIVGATGFSVLSGLSFFPGGDVTIAIPETLQVVAGEILEVPVFLSFAKDSIQVGALGAAVKATNGLLSFVDFTTGPIVTGDLFDLNAASTDSIRMAFVDLGGGPITQEGLLVTMRFQADENAPLDAISLLRFSDLSAADAQAEPLSIIGDNGKATIVKFVSVSGNVRYCVGDPSRPVSGFDLLMTRGTAIVGRARSDSSGGFRLENILAGTNYLLEAHRVTSDDVEAVTPGDALLAIKAFLGALSLSGCQSLAADVDANLIIQPVDALLIFNFYLRRITAFPTELWRPFPSDYDIDANPNAWKTAPASRTYVALTGSLTDQDFNAVMHGDVSLGWPTPDPLLAQARPATKGAASQSLQLSIASAPALPTDEIVKWQVLANGSALQQGLHAFGAELQYRADLLEIVAVRWTNNVPNKGFEVGYNVLQHEAPAAKASPSTVGRLRLGGFSTSAAAIQATGALVEIEARLRTKLEVGMTLPLRWGQVSTVVALPGMKAGGNTLAKVESTFEEFSPEAIDGAVQIADLPTEFALSGNYPNPFNPTTQVRYQLPEAASVTMTIFNALGQRVRTLVKIESQVAGYYEVEWNGRNDAGSALSSGVYFCRFEARASGKTFAKNLKMSLVK